MINSWECFDALCVAALINAAKNSLPYSLQETVFAVAADLVLSDGYVTELEQSFLDDFLDDLYQSLNISDKTATRIVKVMIIENRG
ncbi:hypothetical protein DSM106972_041610 [Dulcicalothrix desertica PCC 7102]|uniref:Co-chaperone DjlA N-terminal domain-containing protein n=1 Tax=Dulcicalothrix desertica PCC 7102 TaxID=232991 RepID=A0A433VEQ0_9CYAN|nr:hypothetical protein DSM106972_041610 [Dulcicalothrix desertica PCC 7102]